MDVNQKELAAILGVTDRRIRQLKDEFGLFAKGMTEGKRAKNYCLEKCIPEYINYKLEAEAQGGTKLDREKEQAEHERIKKKISILRLRKLRRELHEAADVEEFLTQMLMSFKNKLLTIPQKVASIIVGEDDINKVMEKIEKEIFESLEELSEYDPLKIDKELGTPGLHEIEEDEEEYDDDTE